MSIKWLLELEIIRIIYRGEVAKAAALSVAAVKKFSTSLLQLLHLADTTMLTSANVVSPVTIQGKIARHIWDPVPPCF